MRATVALQDGSVLHIERDYQDAWSEGPESDPSWRFTDAAGHEHYFDREAYGDAEYPTLRALYDEDHECYLCHGEGYAPFLGYECRECGEVIKPKMTFGRRRIVIAGQQRAWLDNVRTGDPEYIEAALAKGATMRHDMNGAVLDGVPVSKEGLAVIYARVRQERQS